MRERRQTGSYEIGRARRLAILDAATSNFAAQGYHTVPLAKIAADVGLSESGLLHYFPSKKILLLAVAERRLEATELWWQNSMAENSPVEYMKKMIGSARYLLSQPGLIELFVLMSSEAADATKPGHELYAQWYERAVQSTADQVRSGILAGHFRTDTDSVAVARETIAVTDGLQLQWVLSDGSVDIVEGVRTYAMRLARSILTDAHRGLERELLTA